MKILLFSLFAFFSVTVSAQSFLDTLHEQLQNAKEDTAIIKATGELSQYYGVIRFDSSIYYADQTLDLSEKLKYTYGLFLSYRSIFAATNSIGDYPKALEWALKELKAAEQLKDHRLASMAWSHFGLELVNREVNNDREAIMHFNEAVRLQTESGEPLANIHDAFSQMAVIYLSRHQLDSALAYAQKGYELSTQSNTINKIYVSVELAILGTIEQTMGNNELAEKYYRMGMDHAKKYNILYLQARLNYNLAGLFNKMNKPDSCISYALTSLQLCQQYNYGSYAFDASKTLMQIYESRHNADSTVKYMRLMLAAKDTIFNQQKARQFQLLVFDEKQRQQEIESAKEKYRNQIRTVVLLSALGVFLMIAFILYRNNTQKQKANKVLESTLTNLRSTQSQLIHAEKMASLGELTAGIAHEIQNPLNFVNNFSEVNKELIEELKGERQKVEGERNTILENEILNDIEANEEKINHHGKRADAIVKGMLQHSRSSTGQKELTDINALADEYLRLSYHGLRAKDKSFNATLNTDFDAGVGKINIIPQDIGRVLLNLYNNAFYAVGERQKTEGSAYHPTIIVATKRSGDQLSISVSDNGNGIPQKIIDKIFQPFFTTKPTGQGTGLGLSLSYDIIKSHGGEIKVNTKEKEGTEFVIQLPVV
jgi:signal transduction histidine kinase